MNPARWESAKRLFHDALARPPAEREQFVREAAAGDEELRDEIWALLTAHTRADAAFGDVARSAPNGSPAAHALPPGMRLGPYEIDRLIGVGGMGEVYRAHDTKLRRDVAIKVLPFTVAHDPDRLQRFEREAHLLASLNHPHIAAIYGFEEATPSSGSAQAVHALVLELVEGPTLADRIASGPVVVADALAIARQIADALDAAHDRGIVHRDLKPANVKLTRDGTVKVLDFGLAKAMAIESRVNLMDSPTLTAMGTREGVVAGTAPYMSPEQARGQAVDKRTDIWAFGCVLYELLTGARAFPGDTTTDVLASVINREPDWTQLPAATPAAIRTLLRRCLVKDRKRRLADAADARLEIDEALASPAGEPLALASPTRSVAPIAIAALVSSALLAALVMRTVMRPEPQAPVLPSRFAIVTPSAQPLPLLGLDRDLALSPDGRHLVYRAGWSTSGPLMVRAIDQLDAQPLAGITNARQPFFSPDSQWIGFFDEAELKKVSIMGGPAITLCRLSVPGPRGATWGDDNTIVFATVDATAGLWRVSAGGGEPTVLTTPDAARHEGAHRLPSVLPGGRGVLFTIATSGQAEMQVAVLDLKTGQRTMLIHGGSAAEYVETGHLIYAAAGTLRAVRFDLATLEVLSDPVLVVEHVLIGSTGAANYAVSRSGTLVYVPGGVSGLTTPRSLVWVDRKGHETPIKAPLRAYVDARLSPDGTRIAMEIRDQENDLWIWDLARETLTRLTSDPSIDSQPVWTPDGRRIIFASQRAGVPNVYGQAADGTGTVDRLMASNNTQAPTSITPDGTRVIGFEVAPKTTFDVVLFPSASPASWPRPGPSPGTSPSRGVATPSQGSGEPGRSSTSEVRLLVQTPFVERNAEISPDGRYLAYESNESGQFEIYVRPFPQMNDGRWQVSTGGGMRPAWARNSRELFYLDQSNTLTAVPVRIAGATFSAGNPAKVFDTKYAVPAIQRTYDVSPDGQRFLMIKDSPAGDPNATPASIVVVEHWFEELKAKSPAGK